MWQTLLPHYDSMGQMLAGLWLSSTQIMFAVKPTFWNNHPLTLTLIAVTFKAFLDLWQLPFPSSSLIILYSDLYKTGKDTNTDDFC